MKTTWEKKYTLRAGDFDKFNHLKPSAVLDLFQDAAGQHAEELGLGFTQMLNRSYLWVITRVAFKVVSAPSRYQTVYVKTWPLEPRRLNYRREYCITDENGMVLIKGSSEWVIVHSEQRKLLSVPQLYPFTDGFCRDTMFDEKLSKVADFEAIGTPYMVNTRFSELDVNNHVNNIKYADFVIDALVPSADDILETFQIDYRKEVVHGTQLNVYFVKEENHVLAKGQNTSGDNMFACKIQFKR